MLKVDQNSVEARPATGERYRPADFGGQEIARGAADLGRGLAQAGENIDRINEIYDTAAVKKADAEDLKKIMEIKAGAMQATGFDAQTAVGNARKEIDDLKRARLATLKGRQARLYTDVFDGRALQIEESFSNHLAKQTTEANKNAATARAEVYRDAAVDTYGTPEFENNLATAEGEVTAINKGAGSTVIGLQQAKLRSQVYSRVVEGMLADPNRVQEAKQTLDEHAADILPEEETALRKKLNPLVEEDQVESDAGWAFTNSPVPGARDPLAPTEGPDTPPRPSIENPSTRDAPVVKPISPTDPLRGRGQVTNTAQQHRARGSGNALDIAAPAGTPIYAPMSGKVIKNWWSEEGGWSVLVEHPNGYVTGYAHMRAQSPLREGEAIEPTTVLGGVGTTGTKSTGPHVHYTVRQSQAGPKVDPNAVDWGDTVKPDSVSWKEAPLVKYQADENALGRALDRVYQRATSEGWSNRRYQSAVTRVRQIAGVQNELFGQQQEDRWRGALAQVVELDDKLTSVTQIKDFGLLEPQHQLSIKNIIKQNLSPASEEGKANGPVFIDLLDASIDPGRRGDFLSVDLLSEQRITRGERSRLVARQAELRNAPDGQLSARLDDAWGAANRYLPAKTRNNEGFSQQQRQQFADRFMEAQQAKQNELKRALTDREKDDIARGLVVPVVRIKTGGDKGGEGLRFEYGAGRGREPGDVLQVDFEKVYAEMPPETQERIRVDLKRRGHNYSKQDIVRVFLNMSR